MNQKKSALLTALSLCAGGIAYYKYLFRMPLKEYTRYALYMAVLDDETARNMLSDQQYNGKCVVFPPKAESLQYRYHIFLEMNQKKSRKRIKAEIANMELRLIASKNCLHKPNL